LHEGAEHRADHLGDDVRHKVARREAACDGEPDAHSRIQVAARDVADRIGHGQHRKTESERNAHETDAQPMHRASEVSGEDGAAAAPEDEPEGAEQLGSKAL
jgi:hypothetical protein